MTLKQNIAQLKVIEKPLRKQTNKRLKILLIYMQTERYRTLKQQEI